MAAANGRTDRAKTAFEPPLLLLASLALSFALSRKFGDEYRDHAKRVRRRL